MMGMLPSSAASGGVSVNPALETWSLANIETTVVSWNTNNPSKSVCYLDVGGVIDGVTGVQSSDHLHPTIASYIKIANWKMPITAGYLNGSSFTVSGPSSGNVGQASSNFTVNLAGGSSFPSPSGNATATMAITVSDGGAGGTFTPSLGSPFTGSGTITPTSGSSFTFTYTPASGGNVTLTFGDQQTCWTDPSPKNYMAGNGPSSYISGATLSGAVIQ